MSKVSVGVASRRSILLGVTTTIATASLARSARTQTDPLSSWNDGRAKQAILDFVRTVSSQVPAADRIATFDQDGTLWVEHPLYAQAVFALDRMHTLAPHHPEWKGYGPFRAVLANDMAAVAKLSEREWAEIIFATHAGMSQADFQEIVRQWLATAKHPRFNRPYTELTYQPMREVMDYLRSNGFRIYIVTGGGVDFVRNYAERIYGVPPEQVIGSSITTKYEIKDAEPEIIRLPKLFFDDDHAGKVLGIDLFIGKRPYAAFGNSTGDREMLEWTGAGEGSRLTMLVHHDDAQREYAYEPADRRPDTKIGRLPLIAEAKAKGWTVISIKNDWKRIFAFE